MANRGGTPSGGDDADHRSTKAERKEQARLERERIQQQMRARHRNRNIGLTLVALALVTVVVVIFVLQPKTDLPSPATLLSQAAAATKTAGCTAPQPEGFYDNISDPNSTAYADRTHIGSDPRFPTMPPLSTYPSIPPASGPHNPTPLDAGVYSSPPPVDQAIHSLEHAAAIVWYAPSAPSDVISQIKKFYTQKSDVGQAKIIVAPYSYPSQGTAGQLPSGVEMAIVAWHFLQTCAQPSLAVAYSFTSQYSNATPGGTYIGKAPEPQVAI